MSPRKEVIPSVDSGRSDGAYKWVALLVVSVGTFMGTMDTSIVNIAFPTLTEVFQTDAATVLWVALGYLLAATGLMLIVGRLADLVGHKRVYTFGIILFTIGLGLCALAQTIFQLIAFRVVQAVGMAITMAVANAIVTDAFPTAERGKALGILESVVGVGLMSGPALGGLLLDVLDWRSLFYLRLPICAIGAALAWALLRERVGERGRGFDLWGAATLFLGLSALLLAVNQGQRWGWGSAYILGLGLVAVVLLGLFLIIESRVPRPVVALGLFRIRLFAVSSTCLLIYAMATLGVTFLLPFYLIQALELPSSTAGLLLTTVPLMWFLLSPGAGWLSDRIGSRYLATGGLVLLGVGILLLSRLDLSASWGDVVLRLGVMGLGGGLFLSPNYSSIMGSVPRERLGTASALIPTARTIGHACGLALAGTIFTSRMLFYSTQNPAQADTARLALVGGFQDALLASFGLCALAVVISWLRGRG